jgi:intermediate peptidase
MDSSSNTIRPWDKYYYAQFIQNTKPKLSKQYLPLSSYFSVGNVFNGLSDIFYALYRVRLVVQDIIPGEVWHSEVRKLSVVHETEGVIGTIYCDLFQREAEDQRKYDNAAHFTIRCCRRIDNDEPERQTNIINSMHERVLDTPQGKKRYQIPIVVLVTSFSRPQNDIPGLLDLTDIETLFHEMGHAMHCNGF